jgi:threonine dehydrogenase-like Zn-dependent dehydrogenase
MGLGERTGPVIKASTDAVVRITRTCVCGSDLWYYRGQSDYLQDSPIGHEFLGIVEQVGDGVKSIEKGELVIAPFLYCDGTCPNCRKGITSACVAGGVWGVNGIDGGQGEAARVPLADGTLIKIPDSGHSDKTLASLLTLSDVLCTGHHAAVCANVKKGDTVVIVGDGTVGLCAIIASKRLDAQRIISLSRNPSRQKVAREFGATDIIAEGGKEAYEAVMGLTDGVGVDASLECVGTNEAMQTALSIARPGSTVGYVGVPHGVQIPVEDIFYRNVGVHGGPAPARAYMPELLDDILKGHINPGLVFDFTTDLNDIEQAYSAMNERRAIKSLVKL